MNNNQKHIILIYENSSSATGDNTEKWLLETGLAQRKLDNEDGLLTGIFRKEFIAGKETAISSAIVFVTDEASRNEEWRKAVNAVPAEFRMIPVGRPDAIEINNTELIPASLESVNFIRPDEYLFNNLKDSLTTDPEFYSLKTNLMQKKALWDKSYDEGALLVEIGKIRNYLKIIQAKLQTESDQYFRSQLIELVHYLKLSRKHARKVFAANLARWLMHATVTVLAVLLFVYVLPNYDRAKACALNIEPEETLYDNSVNAVILTEISTNKYSVLDQQKDAHDRLSRHINKVWPCSPIAENYIPAINDFAIQNESQYLWTATGNGKVVCWDTYSGKIIKEEKVTDKAIRFISVSEDSRYIVCMDEIRNVYLSCDGLWQGIAAASSVKINEASMKMYNSFLVISDKERIEVYRLSEDGIYPENTYSYENIIDVCIKPDRTVTALCAENGKFVLITDGIKTKTDITYSENCKSDVKDQLIVLTDVSGQVYAGTVENLKAIPLRLNEVIDLEIINDETIAYSDRFRGSGLFDINFLFDYGDIFSPYTAAIELEVSDEMLVMRLDDYLLPISLVDILGYSDINLTGAGRTFDQNSDTCAQGILKEVSVNEEGIVIGQIESGSDQVSFIMDTDNIYLNESGYKSNQVEAHFPEEYSQFEFLQDLDGKAEIIGITYEPANNLNTEAFNYLILGLDNGTFVELGMNNNITDGIGFFTTSVYQLPSHSAIREVIQKDGNYIIRDSSGLYWHVYSGVNTPTVTGMYAKINEKLHCAFSKELIRKVSKETGNKLKLSIYPGSNGKVWE